MEKTKTEIQKIFNLPLEEKKNYWQTPGDLEGFGQNFVVSEEQKLDWCDVFVLTTFPVHMRKPHIFTKLPSAFRFYKPITIFNLNNKQFLFNIKCLVLSLIC